MRRISSSDTMTASLFEWSIVEQQRETRTPPKSIVSNPHNAICTSICCTETWRPAAQRLGRAANSEAPQDIQTDSGKPRAHPQKPITKAPNQNTTIVSSASGMNTQIKGEPRKPLGPLYNPWTTACCERVGLAGCRWRGPRICLEVGLPGMLTGGRCAAVTP